MKSKQNKTEDQHRKEDAKKSGSDSAKMSTTVMSQYPTYNQQIFSDEELSEIFQIDFAEIFGSPDQPSKKKFVPGQQKTGFSTKGRKALKEKCLQLVVSKWFKRFASNKKKKKTILLYLDSKEKNFVLLLFDLKST